MVGQLQSSSFLSWITIWQSDEATRSIQWCSSMEHGRGDKYIASHPAYCSLLVWVLCFVRYFMSSSAKLNTNHKSKHVGFGSSSHSRQRYWCSSWCRRDVCCPYIPWCSDRLRMPVSFSIFGCYTICFGKAMDYWHAAWTQII